MNMIGIKCPHCGADLKINDEIDMFYCDFYEWPERCCI